MPAQAIPFAGFVLNLFGGSTIGESRKFDWLSDDIKLMLVTNVYVPDQATHKFKSSITNEVVGAGYVAGGASLTGKTITYDSANHVIILDANDVVWAGATLTARYAILYDNREAADADRELIGYIDFGSDQSSVGVDFQVGWSASGILRFPIPIPA